MDARAFFRVGFLLLLGLVTTSPAQQDAFVTSPGLTGRLWTGDSLPARSRPAMISTVAGTGVTGFNGDGIPAVDANLRFVTDVKPVFEDGFLFASQGQSCIRKVDRNGIISTVAGTCNAEGLGGYSGDGLPATDPQVELYFPSAIATLFDGSLLIADTSNHCIRMVDPEGIIDTVAGQCGTPGLAGNDGPPREALLNEPSAVAVRLGSTAEDAVFLIGDFRNNCIREVDLAEDVIRRVVGCDAFAYDGDGGNISDARIGGTSGIVYTGGRGDFYFADYFSNRVRRVFRLDIFDPVQVVVTAAGSGDPLPEIGLPLPGYSGDGSLATDALLSGPTGIWVFFEGSYLIADAENNRVRRVFPDGTIDTIAGSGPTGPGNGGYNGDGIPALEAQLNRPYAVAADAGGNILIADQRNRRIRMVTPAVEGMDSVLPPGVVAVHGWSNDERRFRHWRRDDPEGSDLNELEQGQYYFFETSTPTEIEVPRPAFNPSPTGQSSFMLQPGFTQQEWRGWGVALSGLFTLPTAITAVFHWNSQQQTFEVWDRVTGKEILFPQSPGSLAQGLLTGETYFFYATQPAVVQMPGGGLSDPFGLIEIARVQGRIDDETALMYQVFSDFGDERLPEEFRGDGGGYPEARSVEYASAAYDSLSSQMQEIIRPFLLPPDDPESWYQQRVDAARLTVAGAFPFPVPWQTVPVNGKVIIRYPLASPGGMATSQASQIRRKALEWRDALRNDIWPTLTSAFGEPGLEFLPNEGGNFLAVYLMPPDIFPRPGLIGASAEYPPFGKECPKNVFLVLLPQATLSDVAHEFFHTIHNNYSYQSSCLSSATGVSDYKWMFEASATWMEDYVYPTVQQEHLLAPKRFAMPGQSMGTVGNLVEYGDYLLFLNLHRFFDCGDGTYCRQASGAQSVWRNVASAGSIDSIISAVAGQSSFNFLFRNLALYNWNREPIDKLQRLWDPGRYLLSGGARPRADFDVGGPVGIDGREIHFSGSLLPLTTEYTRFRFSSPAVRSIVLENNLADNPEAEVQILYKVRDPDGGEGEWKPGRNRSELVTRRRDRAFCRDIPEEDITELVVIISNASKEDTLNTFDTNLRISSVCGDWEGMLTGSVPGAQTTTRVRFRAGSPVAGGVTVNYSLTGFPGCEPSGTLSRPFPDEARGALRLIYDGKRTRIGSATTSTGSSFTLDPNCPGKPPGYFVVGEANVPSPGPGRMDTVVEPDHQAGTATIGQIMYTWDLRLCRPADHNIGKAHENLPMCQIN